MWELVPSLLMLNLKSSKTGISSRAGLKANLTTVRMILHARFDIPQESFFYENLGSKGFACLWKLFWCFPAENITETHDVTCGYSWVSCQSSDCAESFPLSLICRGDLFYRGGCREEPLYQLDRVITIEYQIPPEQLTLEQDTTLSSLEEGALSQCSQAEHMISSRAYDCLKNIVREVCRTKAIVKVNFNPTFSCLIKWAAFNLSSYNGTIFPSV